MERWGIKGRFKAVRQNTVLPGHGYLINSLFTFYIFNAFYGKLYFFVIVLLNILVWNHKETIAEMDNLE